MLKDLRHAIRLLGRAPGFTAVCVATLALGIGANTALFSVAEAVLWRPLPLHEPAQLRMVFVRAPAVVPGAFTFSAGDVVDLQKHTRVYSSVAAYRETPHDLSGAGQPFRVSALAASHTLFPLLGRGPAVGRVFTAQEDRDGHRVTVLGHALAARLYGSAPAALGRTVMLDRIAYRVIGVMGPEFRFPFRGMSGSADADLLRPISFSAQELADRGDNFNYSVLARLAPGVPTDQERADTRRVLAIARAQYPAQYPAGVELLPEIVPLADRVSGPVEDSVLLLLGAVAFLLLIACANVANLTFTRALGRRSELAVRGALGASRGRLARQLLTESLVLGLVGGAAGLALAFLGTDLIVALAGDSLPRAQEVAVNGRALLFSLGTSLLAGLLFGTAPVLALRRDGPGQALKEAGRGPGGGNRGRLRSALVVAEVALAVVLLTGAGLLVRTLVALQKADPGFRPERSLAVELSLPEQRYATFEQTRAFHDRLSADLAALPGVERIAIGTNVPFGGTWTKIFSVEGVTRPGDKPVFPRHGIVTPDYFVTLGIPLVRGRLFGPQDAPDATRAILVNQTFARRAFGNGEAVGRRIKNGMPDTDAPWLTIVGVVGDIRTDRPDEPVQPQTYELWTQSTEAREGWFRWVTYLLRTSGPSASLVPSIRAAVARIDPDQALARIAPLPELLAPRFGPEQFRMRLLLGFAATALLLSAIGVGGVVAIGVTQRHREIGVRMALGADQRRILRGVVSSGMRLVAIGVGLGLGVGLALSRLVAAFLYGVPATDPTSYGLAALLLLSAGLIAAYLPARRAASVDPMVALRAE